jgi:hypothetical protein
MPGTNAGPSRSRAMSERSYDHLDARLDAQRRALRWLLARFVTSPELFADLIENLDQPSIPQDHQEDPGAVPTEEFGAVAAYAAEIRAILDPVKRLHRA